jgi:hypothetical protein
MKHIFSRTFSNFTGAVTPGGIVHSINFYNITAFDQKQRLFHRGYFKFGVDRG